MWTSLRSRVSFVPFLLAAGLLASTADAKLALKLPKYTITADVGSIISSEKLEIGSPIPVLTLDKRDTLKFTFTVVDDSSEDDGGVQPHQAFLRFYDGQGEEGIQPVKITNQGKGKFELNPRKPPPGLPPTSEGEQLFVDLILGSFTSDSSVIPIFKLALPASLPVPAHPEASFYAPQPLIQHTFRAPQKTPPQAISKVFVALALSPWVVLIGLLAKLPIHATPSVATAPFIVLLVAFEGLIVWYWVDLQIGQVLSYGALLALVTAAAGKTALASL